jgi:type II secretory pathway pseudopilin PulG
MRIGSPARGLEPLAGPADRGPVPAMPARLRDEEGFGLIELAFAMLMLNIGILALVAAFNSGAVSLRRAATTSNGTAVADKVMEVYRDLKNDAIYLNSSSIPLSGSTYTAYSANTAGYACASCSPASVYPYYTSGSAGPWVTQNTTGSAYTPIAATNTNDCPGGSCASMSSPNPTLATQSVAGPDGQSYTVYTYIVLVPIQTGGYVKQVTVYVLDPRNSSHVLVREQSLFDPAATR